MTKPELIKNVTEKANERYTKILESRGKILEKKLPQDMIEAVLDSYGIYVADAIRLNNDEKIPVPNLGTFQGKIVYAKSGVVNGVKWTSPEHITIKFVTNSKTKSL